MFASRNIGVAGHRTCCGSQPGGCGSATYLCSVVCGMLLTRNRVYTAYELGFTTCGVVTVIPAVTSTACGSASNGLRVATYVGRNRFRSVSNAYLKGTRPEQFHITSTSSQTLTLTLWSLSHVLRTTKRV